MHDARRENQVAVTRRDRRRHHRNRLSVASEGDFAAVRNRQTRQTPLSAAFRWRRRTSTLRQAIRPTKRRRIRTFCPLHRSTWVETRRNHTGHEMVIAQVIRARSHTPTTWNGRRRMPHVRTRFPAAASARSMPAPRRSIFRTRGCGAQERYALFKMLQARADSDKAVRYCRDDLGMAVANSSRGQRRRTADRCRQRHRASAPKRLRSRVVVAVKVRNDAMPFGPASAFKPCLPQSWYRR